MTERIRVYRGWKITRDDRRPVTGIYRAVRHGVGMCAGDSITLLRMIDTRAEEERIARERRGVL